MPEPASHINETTKNCARYNTAVALAFPHAVATIINFATKEYDPFNEVTTGVNWKYTIVRNGIYLVASNVLLDVAAIAAAQYLGIQLYKNGVIYTTLGATVAPAVGNSTFNVNGATMLSLVSGDYVDLRLYQTSGAARNLYPNAADNHVSITRLGRAI